MGKPSKDGIILVNIGVPHFVGFLLRSREAVHKQDREGKVAVFEACSGKLNVL